MTFDEMLEQAKRVAGGQNALSRMVGGSHNIVRQWQSGMGLPSTPDQEATLAKLVGIAPDEVHEIVWLEHRRRWESRRGKSGAQMNCSVPVKPLVKARSRLYRRQAVAG